MGAKGHDDGQRPPLERAMTTARGRRYRRESPYLMRAGGVGDDVVLRGFVVFFGAASVAAASSCGYFFVLGQINRHG